MGVLSLLALVGHAAERAKESSKFLIAPQPLESALIAFSEQSGLQLVAVGDIKGAPATTGLRGTLPNETALRALLARSGFSYLFQPSGIVTVSPVLAPAAKPPQPAYVQATPVDLAVVQVTARRRSERRIDVPLAITAMDDARLDSMGIDDVAQAIASAPGASSVDTGGGFTQVQIRGVSSSLGGNDNGYYLDEIPFTGVTVPWYPDTRTFDLKRVEVLRGPQGTLFGEGSMGGTVRILTNRPALDELSATFEGGLSTTGSGGIGWSAKAMVNVPVLEDRLAVRVVATDEELPGWVDDVSTGAHDINSQRIHTRRVRVRFVPVDRWTIDASRWSYRSEAPGGGYAADDAMQVSYFYGRDARWSTSSLVGTYEGDRSQVVYALAAADLEQKQMGEILPGTAYASAIDIGVRTNELRWSSTGEQPVSWAMGIYNRQASRADASAVGSMTPSAARQKNDATAVFGEATLRLADPAWSVTAGLRYFTDDVEGVSFTDTARTRFDARFHSWNPRLGLSWTPLADTTFYASMGRGFRSGQLQPITSLVLAETAGIALPTAIKPDAILTSELGAKILGDEGRLLLEGALFHSRWQRVPVRVPITDAFNGLINSEGAEIRGAELSLTYAPVPALTLQLDGSWIDATYVDDVAGTSIRAGTPIYNVPRFVLGASGTYTWSVARDLQGVVRMGARYHAARKISLTQGEPGDSILAADLRFGLEAAEGWGIYAFGENLADERGAVVGRTKDGLATRLRPRTFGIEFRISYR